MISSYEVQNIVSNQQQMMMGAQQYASQSNMVPMGYSAHNLPAGLSVGNQPFSYRNSEINYGMGNAAGMAAVGGMQGAYKAGSFGVAAAGAYAGYKLSGTAMGAMKGALSFGGPLIAGGMLAGGHVFGNMMEGAEENQQIYRTLGQNHQFINGNSRTGRGFGRQEARAIADFTREMQGIPEMMTSMGELTQIMNKISQTGIMNGVRNAQDFNRKFKEALGTLKDVSKIMQTTLEDSSKFFEEARRSGFYSGSAIRMNAGQRQFTAGLTGMNQDQVGQLQAMGAQLNSNMGGSRSFGAQSILRTARQIGVGNELGLIGGDKIEELTGLGGAQGIQAMSGMLASAAHTMSQGPLGHAMAMALGKTDKSGRFTGQMDEDLVNRVRSGGITQSELLSLAHKKTASRTGALSFSNQRDKLTANMTSLVGAEGIAMEMQSVLGDHGWSNPDAVNAVMQKYGVDEKSASAIQEIMKNLPQIQKEIGSKAQMEGRRQAEQAFARENYSTDAIKKKFMKKIENAVSEPLKHIGAGISDSVGEYVDNFMDGILNRHSTQITKETAGLMGGSLGGSSSSRNSMSKMLAGSSYNDFSPGATSYSTADSLLGVKGDNNKYAVLEGLKMKKLAFDRGDGIIQNNEELAGSKKFFGDLQSGVFRKDTLDKLNDTDTATSMGVVSKKVNEILKEHGAELKGMSQTDKLAFIKDKLKDGWFSKSRDSIISLEKQGISLEESVAFAQMQGKSGNLLGAVDFNKLSGEMFGTGNFGTAGELRKAQEEAGGLLSKQFGKQESQVSALLKSDSKSRELFLKAASGDAEAQRLLTENLSPNERDKLLKKFGIDEGQLDSLQGMYGGAKGRDVSPFAKDFTKAMNRSSLGGLATQFRRQGLDIEDRLAGSGLSDGVKGLIGGFASTLTGLTDATAMKSFNKYGAGQVDLLLDTVGTLKGEEREKALSVLGPGAKEAMNIQTMIQKTGRSQAGIQNLLKGNLVSDDVKDYIRKNVDKRGRLDDKELAEVAKRARNETFGGSLSSSGEVGNKNIANQKELTENLTKFAQTTATFAQLVIQATPQLDENVKKAQKNLQNSVNPIKD